MIIFAEGKRKAPPEILAKSNLPAAATWTQVQSRWVHHSPSPYPSPYLAGRYLLKLLVEVGGRGR